MLSKFGLGVTVLFSTAVSFADTLTNIIPSAPLNLSGSLYYQKCETVPNGRVLHLKAIQNNIECHVSFSDNFKNISKEVCNLAESFLIESATCTAEAGHGDAVISVSFNGANFSYKKNTDVYVPPKTCIDLNGVWQYGGINSMISSISSEPPGHEKVRIKQTGCEKVEISFLSTDKESYFSEGVYLTDKRTPVLIDNSGLSFVSFFEPADDRDPESWILQSAQFSGLRYVTEMKEEKNGWKQLKISGYYYNGNIAGEQNYAKVDDLDVTGSCHNLDQEAVKNGSICKTSKGFIWKKTPYGWADMSPGGKSWMVPSNFYAPIDASKYCNSWGKMLPTGPVKNTSGQMDLTAGDAGIAANHQMTEVFPELLGFPMFLWTQDYDGRSWGFFGTTPINFVSLFVDRYGYRNIRSADGTEIYDLRNAGVMCVSPVVDIPPQNQASPAQNCTIDNHSKFEYLYALNIGKNKGVPAYDSIKKVARAFRDVCLPSHKKCQIVDTSVGNSRVGEWVYIKIGGITLKGQDFPIPKSNEKKVIDMLRLNKVCE